MKRKTPEALLLNGRGAPKELEHLMKNPYNEGCAAAKALKIGEVVRPAHILAAAAGFPSVGEPSAESHAWNDHWDFINGFVDTVGEIALAVDKEGRVVSYTNGSGIRRERVHYAVMGAPCERAEARKFWEAECARAGRCPEEIKMFDIAERADGGAERTALLSTAGITITLTDEE